MMETAPTISVKPRLGFVGVGWIGLNRLTALVDAGLADAAVLADPNTEALASALEAAPEAVACDELEGVLNTDVEGVVLATPSGLHAEQAIRALEAGKHVFCQKPLGRTADETAAVVEAARRNDRLLGVDFCYRYTEGMQAVRKAIRAGAIGDVFSADLVFHNAYGPAKSWALDRDLSGGGCLIDLGIHLVDLLLWTLDGGQVEGVKAALFRDGSRLSLPAREVENYASAELDLTSGTAVRLACSWDFSPGRDAAIEIAFYGTEGALAFQNVDGSFYDFTVELRRGSDAELLVEPPDAWGSRAAEDWARRVADDPGFDPGIEAVVEVARVIDMMYGRRRTNAG